MDDVKMEHGYYNSPPLIDALIKFENSESYIISLNNEQIEMSY